MIWPRSCAPRSCWPPRDGAIMTMPMRCGHDPAFRLAVSSAAGMTPLGGPGLASQPTLSRFTAMMAAPDNLKVLREAVLELAGRGVQAQNAGKRLPKVTLDVDSLPIEVHGHQPKAEWNGHYNARIYHPLITSIAEDRRHAGCTAESGQCRYRGGRA